MTETEKRKNKNPFEFNVILPSTRFRKSGLTCRYADNIIKIRTIINFLFFTEDNFAYDLIKKPMKQIICTLQRLTGKGGTE